MERKDVIGLEEIEATLGYQASVTWFRTQYSRARFPCGKPEHAVLLLKQLFLYTAQYDVRIYTEGLSGFLDHEDVIDAASRFVSKPATRLRILFQNPVTAEVLRAHPLVRGLNWRNGNYEIRCAVASYATAAAQKFVVVDEKAHRFEHAPGQAVASFNEPEVAIDLTHAFDKAFRMANLALLS